MTENARPRYGTPRWVKWFAGIVVVLIALVVVAVIFGEAEESDDVAPAAPTATASEPPENSASPTPVPQLEAVPDAYERCREQGQIVGARRGADGRWECEETHASADSRCKARGLVLGSRGPDGRWECENPPERRPASSGRRPSGSTGSSTRPSGQLAAIVCEAAPGIRAIIVDLVLGDLEGITARTSRESVIAKLRAAAGTLFRHEIALRSVDRFRVALINLLDEYHGDLFFRPRGRTVTLVPAVRDAWDTMDPEDQTAMACLSPDP